MKTPLLLLVIGLGALTSVGCSVADADPVFAVDMTYQVRATPSDVVEVARMGGISTPETKFNSGSSHATLTNENHDMVVNESSVALSFHAEGDPSGNDGQVHMTAVEVATGKARFTLDCNANRNGGYSHSSTILVPEGRFLLDIEMHEMDCNLVSPDDSSPEATQIWQ